MTDAVSTLLSSLSAASNSTEAEKKVHSSPRDSRRAAIAAFPGPLELPLEVIGRDPNVRGWRVGDESERARLIHEISRAIRDPLMPETTRTAGLTLIGWLARRMPGEPAHALGVPEARESERRIKAARQKLR